eukprot:TRINITY_DN14190_c0_g1_i1.p1 TRINITY_DN14190_c0_g1~~TRINITY_DN14190_c0_g1_i1.p1  ORF type:complete len:1233 (-),score=240.66 TRINITY_DN14190_c0_g1_i1:38-3736(-)
MAVALLPASLSISVGPPTTSDICKRRLEAAVESGKKALAEGDFVKASEHFTFALDLRPSHAHARVARGTCSLALREDAQARRDFAQVIEREEGFNRNVYVLIALACTRQGDLTSSIRYLTQCLTHFPNFHIALMARGELCIKVREYEKAKADFSQVLLSDPSHLLARRGLGDALRGLGEFAGAKPHYTRSLEEAVCALQSRSELGSHMEALSLAVSPSQLGDGSVASPTDETTLRMSGMDASRHRSAEPCGLFDLDPSPSRLDDAQLARFVLEVLLRRATLAWLAGDLDGAVGDLLEILRNDNRNGVAHFWYGKMLLEQKRHKEADKFLRLAADKHTQVRAPVLALVGSNLLADPELSDAREAQRQLADALQLAPRSREIRLTAWICDAAALLAGPPSGGSPAEALELLDRTIATLREPSPSSSHEKSASAALPSSSAAASLRLSSGGAATPRRRPSGLPPVGTGASGAAAFARASSGSSSSSTPPAQGAVWRGAGNGRTTPRTSAQQRPYERKRFAVEDDETEALRCATFFQLVGRSHAERTATVPSMVYALRAVAASRLGRLEEGLADCQRALTIDPEISWAKYNAQLLRGAICAREGRPEAAVGHLTKAILLQPEFPAARILRATALVLVARTRFPGGTAAADGSSPVKLLTDALEDLRAAETLNPPKKTAGERRRLKAALLVGLGRFREASETLGRITVAISNNDDDGKQVASPRGRVTGTLAAEVLAYQGRLNEAINTCSAVIKRAGKDADSSGADTVAVRLVRARCAGAKGDFLNACVDCRHALLLGPQRSDVHEVSGEVFLAANRWTEALAALSSALKLRGHVSPRLTYLCGLARLADGDARAALGDFGRLLRNSPCVYAAERARDGTAALMSLLEGDFRQAQMRFNALLHGRNCLGKVTDVIAVPGEAFGGTSEFQLLYSHFELLQYRGLCRLYCGEYAHAAQDFAASLASALALRESEDRRCEEVTNASAASHSSCAAPRRPCAPEGASWEGFERYECLMHCNIAICRFMAGDREGAQETCAHLLESGASALAAMGPGAQGLAWFLLGVVRLALAQGDGESTEDAREAFKHSYAFDPACVDGFLARHEPSVASGSTPRMTPSPPPGRASAAGRRPAPLAALGGKEPYVACLHRGQGAFGARLPTLRVQVKDVTVAIRPSGTWPFVSGVELQPSPAAVLGHPDVPSLGELGVPAALPWETKPPSLHQDGRASTTTADSPREDLL